MKVRVWISMLEISYVFSQKKVLEKKQKVMLIAFYSFRLVNKKTDIQPKEYHIESLQFYKQIQELLPNLVHSISVVRTTAHE
jgi:hypothetical protein